jgi:hypothetical protein
MASLFPTKGPPRHASGATLQEAWNALGAEGWLDDEQVGVLEAIAQAALERAIIASLIGFTATSWRAHVVRQREAWEQEDTQPERALARVVAQVTAPTPVDNRPAPRPRIAPAKPVATTLF